MILRRDHDGDSVYFTIDKGGFNCSSSGCTGAINIDGKQKILELAETDDQNIGVLFVAPNKALASLINDMQTARKIIVELPFVRQGRHQFSFSTPVALNWPPKESDVQ